MSKDIDDGGPAYPELLMDLDGDAIGEGGMSLRDYFAGQALAGFCANRDLLDPEDVSQWSYGHADAMLAARGGKDD